MSSSSEENTNLVKCAEEICEVFADSVSSLVLMLVALQEKNKAPKAEMQESIQAVAEQAANIGQIAKELAEEDYEEYPDIQKEILDASEEVFTGSDDLTRAAGNLKGSNLQEGYQQLVDGCRVCGTNTIKLLQIVYGATFKKLAAEQENLRQLAEQLDTNLIEEDPQQFADIAGELVSAALQLSEDLKTQAESEAIPSDKEEMMEIAENIERYANELLDAVNDYLEDPENDDLRIAYEEAKKRLMDEMERAKERVMKSHEIVLAQQQALAEQQNMQNATIDEKIANVKPVVPKEEQIARGKNVLENLDKAGEAVFWNNPKEFIVSTNENMQEVPVFVDGRIADARMENNREKEEDANVIKDEFLVFVDKAKAAFSDPENNEKKEDAIQSYKQERERIVAELEALGVDEEDIPPQPQVDEATFDFDDDDDLIAKTEEAVKKIPKARLEKLQDNYKRLEAIEYCVDNGETAYFTTNAKPLIADIQEHSAALKEEAVKEKDAKKKKVSEKLTADLSPAIQNSQASLKDQGNEEKKEKGLESVRALKDDVIDALVAEGVPKKQAEKVLLGEQRDEEMIAELITLKQNAVEVKNAVEKQNAHAISKELKESVPLVKETCPKIKEKAQKDKEPMLDIYADNIQKAIVPVIKSSNEMIKDPENEQKTAVAAKAIEEYIECIDTVLRKCKATPDEMKVVPKNKIDSEIAKKAEEAKAKALKVEDALFDEDMVELNLMYAELAKTEEEMIQLMKDEAKKSGNKDELKRVESFIEEIEELKEAIEDVKKSPKEKMKANRQKAEEKLRNHYDHLCELQEEEGRPVKEKEKAQFKVDKDLEKLRTAVENAEPEKIKEASNKLMEDLGEYKKLKEAEGEKIDDVVAAIKDANSAAIAAAREPKNVIKRKEAVEKIKEARDKLYERPPKEKTEEKKQQEALAEIEEIEMHAESIILNDEEELYVALEDICQHAILISDALDEEDETKVKAAKEGLEKAVKRKDEVFDKALERCKEKDREVLKKANEKLKDLNNEMIGIAGQSLEDGDMKGKTDAARVNAGKTAQVCQPMKSMIAKPSEVRAEETAQAILEDCKLAEKLAKNPNEKLAKECKEKLKRDMERYERAMKEMIDSADLTPEEREKLTKKLEEAKKNAKEMDKYLERLIKNPKDEEAKKGLEECAKKLEEVVEGLNDDMDVKAKCQCKKTQKAIEKCKETVITKDKAEGEKALAELVEEEEELLKTIDERASKEKNAKTKKEMEKDKEMIKIAIDEAREVVKKSLDSGSDDDIIDTDIACDLANGAVEKFRERLKGGKTKGTKKLSAAERMKYIASARKAIRGKNFAMARDDLMKLRNMLVAELENEDLDPATRAMIEDMIAKIDMALADIEHAEENGLMSQINDMNSQLTAMLSNEVSEQAKAKAKAKGIAARARAGKKSNLSGLIKGARDLANKMKGLKFNIKEEVHEGMDQLSDEAKQALALNDLLDDISNGVDLDSMLDSMAVEEHPVVVEEVPKNRLEAEITAVANVIKQTQVDNTPQVCGDIAVHFRELAKHAANANKEGIIVEGRTISAAIAQFCKELQKAQPLCKDRRTADDMARSLQALRNLSTQLKIVCSVKAATVGKGDVDGDNQLISICQNIGTNMKSGMESLSTANKAKLLKK